MNMSEIIIDFARWSRRVRKSRVAVVSGEVTRVVGLTVEVVGIKASIGEVCHVIVPGHSQPIVAEVVGFMQGASILMPLGELQGIQPGNQVVSTGRNLTVEVSDDMLGSVLDGLGRQIGGKTAGEQKTKFPVDNQPPNPLTRQRIAQVLPTGVRAIDSVLTCGQGQRIGIFAGSGVGKSTLLGMIAKYGKADVNVIGLIGERGREVKDFIETDLGEEGLSRSVVVAATSDQPALIRLKGAMVATALAEYFRNKGLNVMLLMDSVTRFAMAQREVGLAVGEPPATKGYTPSVFALLPKLLERSGMSVEGSITAFYTVLVDGDDMNEPIADAVRGILDGHIVLTRRLAAKNHYPAIDVLSSVSRVMSDIVNPEHLSRAARLRELLSTYLQAEDLISIGAYNFGANPKIDDAIRHYDNIIEFLRQHPEEPYEFSETIDWLRRLGD
jgi:flagellar protein export ATPase FliI